MFTMGKQGLTKCSLSCQSGEKNYFLWLLNSLSLYQNFWNLETCLISGLWEGGCTAFQEALSACRCSPPGVCHHLQVYCRC